MKEKYIKKFRLLFFLILIILFILIFFIKNFFKTQEIDDIMFLKLFSNGSSNNIKDTNKIEYKFNIGYKNLDFKSINLSDTIDRNTLVHEKIAPGTKGEFYILIESNQSLRYKVLFNSLTDKPKNMRFKAYREDMFLGDSSTLEELSEKLVGFIDEDVKIEIKVEWYWNYENNEEENIQDTRDAENIRRYQFDILTIGEEG